METSPLASEIYGLSGQITGPKIGPMETINNRSNDDYDVTGVELNYGRVKLPVSSANFI